MSGYTVVLRYQCEKCKVWQDEVGIVASLAIIDTPTYSKNACKNCGRGKLHIVTAIDISDYATEQAEEIATLKAALDASNAALAEARKFVKKVANEKVVDTDAMRNPYESAYRGYKAEAKSLVASWDSAAVAATTQNAPKQGVTLTDIEIDWLAKNENDAHGLMTWAIRNTPKNQRISAHEYYHGLLNRKDTPANRAAIEARRKKSEVTPMFKVGDKVRIKALVGEYEAGKFDTIIGYEHQGIRKHRYSLQYWDDTPEYNHSACWPENQLEPYNESE